MSQRKHNDVRILNAAEGRGHTSWKNADRYVRRGDADWCRPDGTLDRKGRCLMFKVGTSRSIAVRTSVERRTKVDIAYDTASNSGLASLDAIKHLPIARDPLKMLMIPRKTSRRV
jgi:hypothetical protein